MIEVHSNHSDIKSEFLEVITCSMIPSSIHRMHKLTNFTTLHISTLLGNKANLHIALELQNLGKVINDTNYLNKNAKSSLKSFI